jgi:diguanylate cyclase (GGDEF)-like protein
MADRIEELRRRLTASLEESFEEVRPEGDELIEIGRIFDCVKRLRRSIEVDLASAIDSSSSRESLDGGPMPDLSSLATDLHVYLDQILQQRIEQQMLELKTRAECDPLTGLRHRAAFEARVREEISSTRETTRPFLLILFDLDRFKSVNDRFGHPAGDRLLIEMGELLRTSLPESDEAFRLGGDEFAILCRDSRSSVGERMAQELNMQMQILAERRGWIEAGQLSWGIAVYPDDLLKPSSSLPGARQGRDDYMEDEFEVLIRLADQHLYQCKATRRAGGDQSLE